VCGDDVGEWVGHLLEKCGGRELSTIGHDTAGSPVYKGVGDEPLGRLVHAGI
jgi:hypothetical protein